MAGITIVFGGLLVVVGVVGFVATGSQHFTALIPSAMGVLLALLGALSLKDRLRMHAMHGAALVGILGVLVPGFMGVPKLFTLLGGGEIQRPVAAISQSITAVLCAVFVGLCVRSFIQARRRREAATDDPARA